MSFKKILLLGAGLVTEPLVRYLLEIPGYKLTIASRTAKKAEDLIKGHPRGIAKGLDIQNEDALEKEIQAHDLTISLLPALMHPVVAKFCLKHSKHLMTTSYVSPKMQAMHNEAKSKGLVFMNELGLDPGIDHMSAMKIIHDVQRRGGCVKGFRSYCGGLPAPEANTNPYGYKFSWAPRGVILAATNSAKYLWKGQLKEIPGKDLFLDNHALTVGGMEFEAYPNRDSMPYQEIYGLKNIHTMFRGTLRNKGWCVTLKALADLGFLDLNERKFNSKNYKDLFIEIVGSDGGNLRKAASKKTGLPENHFAFDNIEWLGLMSLDALPEKLSNPLDFLVHKCLEKLQYAPGERDMIVLHHIFDVELGSKNKTITSTLIDFGIPNGQTAMARTVSLPAAIGVKMILDGKFTTPGVIVPVMPEVYNPVLSELETLGIRCVEKEIDN